MNGSGFRKDKQNVKMRRKSGLGERQNVKMRRKSGSGKTSRMLK